MLNIKNRHLAKVRFKLALGAILGGGVPNNAGDGNAVERTHASDLMIQAGGNTIKNTKGHEIF